MLIVNLTGGLGNQMFQYAFGKWLSLLFGIPLKTNFTDALFCTKRDYSLDCFDIEINHASTEDVFGTGFPQTKIGRLIYRLTKEIHLSTLLFPRVITEENYINKLSNIDKKKDYYIEGYWQGEKYLDDSINLQKIFSFSKKISPQAKKILKLIEKTNSVALHVRRGDYVTSQQVGKIFAPCGEKYYQRCIKYLNKITKSPNYFIFSDDINWAKDHIKTNKPTVYVENHKPWEDMYLMSQCKHDIIANSTFSWWPAKLNQNKNKIVLLPKNWTTSMLSSKLSMVSKNWTIINN